MKGGVGRVVGEGGDEGGSERAARCHPSVSHRKHARTVESHLGTEYQKCCTDLKHKKGD